MTHLNLIIPVKKNKLSLSLIPVIFTKLRYDIDISKCLIVKKSCFLQQTEKCCLCDISLKKNTLL